MIISRAALCATIAGADDFVAIAAWARQKRDWLGQFLDLSGGIPSHDRFNAIFRALNTTLSARLGPAPVRS